MVGTTVPTLGIPTIGKQGEIVENWKVALLLSGAIALGSLNSAEAAIYKWTDANGKVHYSNKPGDAANKEVEKVKVNEAYKPPNRTPEEIAELRREKARKRELEKRKAQEMQKRLAATRAQRRKEEARSAAVCAEYRKELDALTSSYVDGGGTLHFHYATEHGKSVSSERQREIIKELKEKLASDECQ